MIFATDLQHHLSVATSLQHLQLIKSVKMGHFENNTKIAETLVNTGFPPSS